ncbi:MAG: hypothetical protein KAQ62_04495 [Cyclobacteriaceae bacterium]|nr:hypothetical protein [Cyclobacteriaceae bacterium]
MKKPVLLIWMCLWSLIIHAEKYSGNIRFLDPGTYQIEYPNQTINIYFKYPPAIGIQKLIAESDLTENEKYAIVNILKDQIDQLPAEFIDKYLNIDIFPLHILNQPEFGFYYDHQIVVEVDNIKNGMSFSSSIKSSFIHELAHLIEQNPNNKKESISLNEYLNAIYRTYHNNDINMNSVVYQNGYVSGYASGELIGGYNASEEFAEIFAHLICEESRTVLMEFMETHPGSILNAKVNRVIDFLEKNTHSLNKAYFFGASEETNNVLTLDAGIDGALLLAAHEHKSYETLDFNSMKVTVTSSESHINNLNPADISTDIRENSNEANLNQITTYYSLDPYAELTQVRTDQIPPNKKQKSKKRKKRNGTGLLIAGTALYIALQLLK